LNDYALKPVDLEVLSEKIEKFLSLQKDKQKKKGNNFYYCPWSLGQLATYGVHGSVGTLEVIKVDFVTGLFDQNRLADSLCNVFITLT
jgi:hypothetical protein